MTHRRLRRQLRILQACTAASALGMVFLAGSAFRQAAPSRQRFGEIDVERINVDGRQLLPGRKRDAGLIFFNDEGDENGGMTWSGATTDGVPRVHAGLSLDQYKQDETITLSYTQTGTERQAGLTVVDRPDASIAPVARMNDAATDAERAKIRQELSDAGVVGGRPRVFAGKDRSGDAKLVLSDGAGKPRLALSVDRKGAAKIEFLDAAGRVIRSVRPPS